MAHKIIIENKSSKPDQEILSCVSIIMDSWDLNGTPDFLTNFSKEKVNVNFSSTCDGSKFEAIDCSSEF